MAKDLFDKTLPLSLKQLQEWFASRMASPLNEEEGISSSSKALIAEEASQFIAPTDQLTPYERLHIYHRQYWWRLLRHLQEHMPLLVRLLGYEAFNQKIGVPYFTRYPPNHWMLHYLGLRLPLWMRQEYRGINHHPLWEASRIDWAFKHSFFALRKTSLQLPSLITSKSLERLLDKPLRLQPHVHLLALQRPWLPYREQLLEQEGDYWIQKGLPLLRKEKSHVVIFRCTSYEVKWKSLTPSAFRFLSKFRKTCSIYQALEQMDKMDEAAHQLRDWLQTWIGYQWLAV